MVVSAVSEADVAGGGGGRVSLEIIFADRGLPKQRNAGLRRGRQRRHRRVLRR
jgi:hypothetical protein